MMAFMDQHSAISLVARLAAVGVIVACAEFIADPKPLQDQGLMSWKVGQLRNGWLTASESPLDPVLRYPNVLAVVGLRMLLAAVILFAPTALLRSAWFVTPAALLNAVFILRTAYGHDGADQMAWIIFSGLAIINLVGTPFAETVYLWFLALQACLAYVTTGLAKASASHWRNGSCLVGILGTSIYGHAGLAELLRRNPTFGRLLAPLLIVWQCSFPMVLVAPAPVGFVILGIGVLFHLTNAYFMGLNTFVWSFLATYPAIIFCIQTRGW
jgi:hypothetical protein